jgi:hypothetical protein
LPSILKVCQQALEFVTIVDQVGAGHCEGSDVFEGVDE